MNLFQIANTKYDDALHYKQDSYRPQEDLQALEDQYTNLTRQLDSAARELEELLSYVIQRLPMTNNIHILYLFSANIISETAANLVVGAVHLHSI